MSPNSHAGVCLVKGVTRPSGQIRSPSCSWKRSVIGTWSPLFIYAWTTALWLQPPSGLVVADTAQSTKTGSIYSLALHTGSGAAPAPDHTLGSEAVGPSAPFTFTSARHGRYRRNCHTLASLQSDGNYCRLSSSAYDTSAVHTHARTRTHTHTTCYPTCQVCQCHRFFTIALNSPILTRLNKFSNAW